VTEKRRLRELEHELKNPNKLFDADLFLAQLKQPRLATSEFTSLIPENAKLKEIPDKLQHIAKTLMDVERLFREDLASKTTQVDIEKDVPQLADRLENLRKEIISAADTALTISRTLSSLPPEYLGDFSLSTKTTGGKRNNEGVADVLEELFYYLHDVDNIINDFRNYLVFAHNLFGSTALAPLFYIGETPPPKTGDELIKDIQHAGFPDLAREAYNYLMEMGLAILDPQTTNIRLGDARVLDVLRKIRGINKELENKFMPFKNNEAVSNFVWTMKSLDNRLTVMLRYVLSIIKDCLKLSHYLEKLGYNSPPSKCAFFLDPSSTETFEPLKFVPENLTFTMLFNDIAYAIHRVAEMVIYLSNYIGEKLGIKNASTLMLDKCHVPVYSNIKSGPLLNFAVAWLNTVCQLANHDWFAPEDSEKLAGYIIDDTTAWFRVGSMYNHATHIRKEGDTWVMRYHDTDEPVNALLAKLWGSVPNTEVEVVNNGVVVKTKDDNALPFLGALLSFATSMDMNLGNWGKGIRGRMISLAEKISPQLALIVKAAFSPEK
jgi:hypothetical protein